MPVIGLQVEPMSPVTLCAEMPRSASNARPDVLSDSCVVWQH